MAALSYDTILDTIPNIYIIEEKRHCIMKMVNWLFTQSHGGTEVVRSRRDRRFLRVFVPLCETKTTTLLSINYTDKTGCVIIYP